MDMVQSGKDAYIYLKNPPRDFLPKLGVITVSGLAGLVSARKGSRFKKIAYPLGLATLGATVTGKKAYTTSQQIYEAVKSLWTKINKKESFPKPKEKSKLGNSAEIEIPAKTTDSLKYSVPLTELSSETKTKSESTSEQSLCLTPSSWITGSPIQKMWICTALEAEIVCVENYEMCEVENSDEKI
ncbi:hypothetical protein GH733_012098, partial [Mirounga leonina]